MGEPLEEKYVLAAMVVRLNTLAKGYSGVSRELMQQLETFINKRIIPVVPEHGAVGTSGDLVQLAHIALALIGEGDVFYKGKRERTTTVLKRLGISRYALKPKEGLSLINGTSMMSGIASLICVEARRLLSISIRNGAFSLELVGGFSDSISKELHALRPHRDRNRCAVAAEFLSSSKLLRNRKKFQHTFGITKNAQVPSSSRGLFVPLHRADTGAGGRCGRKGVAGNGDRRLTRLPIIPLWTSLPNLSCTEAIFTGNISRLRWTM